MPPPQRGDLAPRARRQRRHQGKGHTGPWKPPPWLSLCPRPQPGQHQASEPVLTHVCLEPFFSPTEKGSKPESANSNTCLSILPLPPQGESPRHRAGPQRGSTRPRTQGAGRPTDGRQSHLAGPGGWAQAGKTPLGRDSGSCSPQASTVQALTRVRSSGWCDPANPALLGPFRPATTTPATNACPLKCFDFSVGAGLGAKSTVCTVPQVGTREPQSAPKGFRRRKQCFEQSRQSPSPYL